MDVKEKIEIAKQSSNFKMFTELIQQIAANNSKNEHLQEFNDLLTESLKYFNKNINAIVEYEIPQWSKEP